MSKISTSHQVSGADSEGLENGADLDPRIQVRHKTPPVYNEVLVQRGIEYLGSLPRVFYQRHLKGSSYLIHTESVYAFKIEKWGGGGVTERCSTSQFV